MFRAQLHHRRFGRTTAVMVGGGALGLGYGMAAALAPLPAAAAPEESVVGLDEETAVAPVTADAGLTWMADLTVAVEITPLRDQPDQIEKATEIAEDPELVTTAEVALRARPSDGADSLATLAEGTELGADADPEIDNGYTLVYTEDGVTGYVRTEHLEDYVEPVVESEEPAASTASASADEASDSTSVEASAPVSTSGGVVGAALSREGATYGYGGTGPWLFDCSGLVAWSYAQIGVSLPHSSGAILNAGTVIPASEAQPGDVIWSPGHVSIYLGGDQQVEAVGPGRGIHQTRIWQNSPVFVRF